MLLLNNADIARVLDMRLCIDALDSVFHEIAADDAAGMGRIDVYVPSGGDAPYYRWAVMSGGSRKLGYVCARMLSDMVSWPVMYGHRRENKYAREPGTFCGLLFLYSTRDATPVAMLNDGFLQHVRVGGAAALGVRYLAREDSRSVGMIGSGGMARTYLDAFRRVRDIRRVQVWSPNADHVRAYAEEMQALHGIEVVPAASAREAVRGTDIVACCTSSMEPDFFPEWLEPGMHVTDLAPASIGPGFARAVDVAVKRGDITPFLEAMPPGATYAVGRFLSYVAGTAEEQGMVPRLPLLPELVAVPNLADLLNGKIKGRTDPRQTTWFHNLGAEGPQFAAVAAAVYEKARAAQLGHEIPTEWFLQSVRD
jgi:ornithine cyclodeaminase/alanine dehydrogenase-like protein (mu-crystallin family)